MPYITEAMLPARLRNNKRTMRKLRREQARIAGEIGGDAWDVAFYWATNSAEHEVLGEWLVQIPTAEDIAWNLAQRN